MRGEPRISGSANFRGVPLPFFVIGGMDLSFGDVVPRPESDSQSVSGQCGFVEARRTEAHSQTCTSSRRFASNTGCQMESINTGAAAIGLGRGLDRTALTGDRHRPSP